MNVRISIVRRAIGGLALSGALALATGCHSKNAANSGPDPAAANMAPANGQTQVLGENASYAPQQQGEAYPQQAPAPTEQEYPQQGYAQQPGYNPNDAEYAGEEALAESTEPPPPLPEYDQPPAPGPDYIWTPGYWAWGPEGYYWVPGAWVEAPYYGALWTPPYWGWYGGRYRFHSGYWGRHVGYYGGIDYGFGYIGIGYFGGYWNGNNFYYNRAVTRVGPGIRSVYERPVVYNNVRYGGRPNNRVSYNGGRGGINVQPRPTEIAAMHERHDPPMAVQRQMHVQASQNRAQLFASNRGRPAQPAVERGFANTRGIGAAPRGGETGARPGPEGRPGQPNGAVRNGYAGAGSRGQPYGGNRPGQPNAAAPRVENRAGQPQPNAGARGFENRAGQPQPNGRFEDRGAQPNAAQPRVENRAQPQPNAQPRFENRSQPQPNAQPRFENRSQPQPNAQPRMQAPRQENRPMPQQQHMQAQPRMQNRPAPQARPQAAPQNRPAPQARPQAAPQNHPAPQPHGGGGGGHDGEHGHP
jgi:hypothetical protein